MASQEPNTDMADSLRDEARKQNGYSREVEDTKTDDASRLNKFANITWSQATGIVPDKGK